MKITEHEMLVTLASMALKMDDLTGHDVVESLRELGFGHVVTEARDLQEPTHRESVIRESVLWFARQMEQKLKKNDHKGHWSNCSSSYLMERILDEVEELRTALEERNLSEIISETVDVSNFAMMIADNARRRIESK